MNLLRAIPPLVVLVGIIGVFQARAVLQVELQKLLATKAELSELQVAVRSAKNDAVAVRDQVRAMRSTSSRY